MDGQKNIVDNFRNICVEDLKQKQETLGRLASRCKQNLRIQCQERIQSISKVLVDLEDEVVNELRQKFRIILEEEEEKLKKEKDKNEKYIIKNIEQKTSYFKELRKIVESQSASSSKLLSKIAAGKVQQEFKLFEEGILNIKIIVPDLQYEKEEIKLIADDIIELLNIRYGKIYSNLRGTYGSQKVVEIEILNEENEQKNEKEKETRGQNAGENNTPTKQDYKVESGDQDVNRGALSIQQNNLSDKSKEEMNKQQFAGNLGSKVQQSQKYSIFDQFKEGQSIRKAKKLQSKIRVQEHSPIKEVQKLANLALERRRLLKQME